MKTYFNTSNKNTYINYFSCKSISDVINLPKDNPPINNIVSFNSYITLSNYFIKKNKILITYYIIYKILYSSMPNNITYILENKKIGYTEITIPNEIRGESMDNISLRNGLSVQCDIIDTNVIDFNEDNVNLHSTVLSTANVYKLPSIAYILKFSPFEEYVYTSYEYGKNLVQRTFDINTCYEKVKFHTKNYILCIIKNENSKYLRRIFLESEAYEDIYENTNLVDFDIIDNDTVLIVVNNSNESMLLKLNLDTLQCSILQRFNNNSISHIRCLENLIILTRDNCNTGFLTFLTYDGMPISNIKGDFSYINISPCQTIALAYENNYSKIINLISKETYYLSKNLINGTIISSQFLDKTRILLHISNNDKELLTLVNVSKNSNEIILQTSSNISCFLMDKEAGIIYYSLNENNKYNIYSLDCTNKIESVLDIDAINIKFLNRGEPGIRKSKRKVLSLH